MSNEQREKNKDRFVNTAFALVVAAVVLGFVIMLAGCDRSYLPWNASPWSSMSFSENSVGHSETSRIPQAPAEDFCEDNRETVDQYRSFLNPNYVWPGTDTEVVRRRRYCRRFVEQYDRLCFS